MQSRALTLGDHRGFSSQNRKSTTPPASRPHDTLDGSQIPTPILVGNKLLRRGRRRGDELLSVLLLSPIISSVLTPNLHSPQSAVLRSPYVQPPGLRQQYALHSGDICALIYLLGRQSPGNSPGRTCYNRKSSKHLRWSSIKRRSVLQGTLAGYDQKSNVVLSDSKERVYSTDEPVEEIPLGLYLVKGDQM